MVSRFISTNSFVGTMAINPSLALKICSDFFIGGGLYYLYPKCEAENKSDQSYLVCPASDFTEDLEGGNLGYDFCILYKPAKWISLGLSYRSSVDTEL